MKTTVQISTIYHCSLERAFKTPMLCNVAKVHTGFGIMPAVTHCTHDQHWGQPGHSKKISVAKSLTQPGGWASTDTVLDRVENKYWKIEVGNFQSWMLGFTHFTGQWHTSLLEPQKVLIKYTYTLYAAAPLIYTLNWLFTHTFWRIYMHRDLNNIKQMAEGNEPFLYK